MNQSILKYLKTYSYKEHDINRLLVSSFLKINKLHSLQNIFINNLIISDDTLEEYSQMEKFISLFNNEKFSIEILLELFEFVISPEDKEVNGAVYTPQYIREYIVRKCLKKLEEQEKDIYESKLADIACGCGGFFKTIAEQYREKTNKSYYAIYSDNLFGVDIQEYSIVRTKILLILLAIVNGEDQTEFNFNLYKGNSLEFDWSNVPKIKDNNGFDVIVGNPPYVGSSNIDEISKSLLKIWSVTESGKSDLYIPFFQIAIENLNSAGILGYITVSTFQKSLNARALRKYFSSHKYGMLLIDFGGEQLFKNRSTYTCICIITKTSTNELQYVKSLSSEIDKIQSDSFVTIPYDQLNDFEGWYLVDKNKKIIIDKIENTGIALGLKFEIRNGFATLKNKIYVFNPIKEEKGFYYLKYDDVVYKIEKTICRDAIKPNTLKLESEIESSIEKLIFPYFLEKKDPDIFGDYKLTLKALDEKTLRKKFPFAYKYLVSRKDELSKRDKGNREYNEWYAFGRNQALTLSGYKLFLPYITDTPCFVFSDNKDLLFYNGYAIIADNILELLVLKKILMSKLFWFYIQNTSRPYSGNYYSVAKNYIKKFGICSLTAIEQSYLLDLQDKLSIDKFLCSKYDIDYNLI